MRDPDDEEAPRRSLAQRLSEGFEMMGDDYGSGDDEDEE